MKFSSMRILLCLLILVTGARVGSAQQVQPLDPEWLQKMYAEGWEKVQEGVLVRDTGGGEYETFSYGAEGLQWVLEGFERQKAFFESRHGKNPTPELASTIEKLQGEIAELSETLNTTPYAEEFDGEALAECIEVAYGGQAHAGPTQSPQGVTATASAFFHTNCADSVGDTFAVAYAEATEGTVHTIKIQEDPKQGLWVDSSVTASAPGSTGCYSWAQGSVYINGSSVFQTPLRENYACPSSITASIAGPTLVTTDYYTTPCVDVTWTASATGGYPGYTYEWYLGTDTTVQATGATFTKRYCSSNGLVTVKVVASDTQGGTGDATFNTTLQHRAAIVGTISGPDTVSTNSTNPCASVTWTASANSAFGNHSGFTYSWYIGTTLEGAGSTLAKTYCNTNQTVTVKLVATASDGHTSEVTKNTNVVHAAPLSASISGPATVVTDYYTSTCASITWTASATNGSPAYTYRWYLGMDSAVQSTGATFTRQFCQASGTAAVRLVVTDSQGSTAEATFNTTVQYRRQIVPKISGSEVVNTNTTTPCADVTWAASATSNGGYHSGFTYAWYIDTTLEGSGTTLTKSYCSASQEVTVKLVARASDGHTSEVTMTTRIVHDPAPPALTASISGPIQVPIDYAGQCVYITWTATATGGTPAYSYRWYIGTSTTVQGTSSSLTKRFCGTQGITVKVTVLDSGSPVQSTNTTFGTGIYRESAGGGGTCTTGVCP